MIEDVYEPLAKYRDEFKDAFSRLTAEKFAELTERSGVDVEANRRLVAEIAALAASAASQRVRRALIGWTIALAFVGAIVAGCLAGAVRDTPAAVAPRAAIALAALALGVGMIPLYRRASARLEELESALEAKKTEAWEQMAPLNRLYSWDIPCKLVEATVPRLGFDPYFTAERLASLHERFGWDDAFNEGKSIVFAQSGVINGNPFVFGQYLDMEWGQKTYTGSLEISWMDWETDANGRRRIVRRHQTLHGQLTRPVPVYAEHKLLVYGNDAAPDLSFSRQPSGLHGEASGFFERLKKRGRLRELEKYSRDLTDDSDFTLMANREFETWFHAKDRDDEVGFRVLFTPVAQSQLLALMQDEKVGYGDDFEFVKRRKINLLRSRHLNVATIDTDPSRFAHWDYDAARKNFTEFNERYFKDVYFALAPVLAIPPYQQVRTHEEIWRSVLGSGPASFWEHESIANYHGEKRFRHPRCVTRSILKTEVRDRADGESAVAVTAHGFEGVDRVDYDNVLGGDGRMHAVPVEWTEYLPVSRTSEMRLTERPAPTEDFNRRAAAATASALRRSITSYLAH